MNVDVQHTFSHMDELTRLAAALARKVQTGFPEYLSAPFEVREIHERILPYRRHRNSLGLDTLEYYELALTRLLAGEGSFLIAPARMREALRSELESPNPDCSRYREYATVSVQLSGSALALLDGDAPSSVIAGALTDNDSAQHSEAISVADTPDQTGAAASSVRPAPATRAAAGTAKPSPNSAQPVPIPEVSPAVAAIDDATPPVLPSVVAVASTESKVQRSIGGKSPRKPVAAESAVTPEEFRMPPNQRTTSAAELGGKCRYCTGALPDGRTLTYCPHCGQDLTIYHCPACSTELELGWKFCVTCGRGVEE